MPMSYTYFERDLVSFIHLLSIAVEQDALRPESCSHGRPDFVTRDGHCTAAFVSDQFQKFQIGVGLDCVKDGHPVFHSGRFNRLFIALEIIIVIPILSNSRSKGLFVPCLNVAYQLLTAVNVERRRAVVDSDRCDGCILQLVLDLIKEILITPILLKGKLQTYSDGLDADLFAKESLVDVVERTAHFFCLLLIAHIYSINITIYIGYESYIEQ